VALAMSFIGHASLPTAPSHQ